MLWKFSLIFIILSDKYDFESKREFDSKFSRINYHQVAFGKLTALLGGWHGRFEGTLMMHMWKSISVRRRIKDTLGCFFVKLLAFTYSWKTSAVLLLLLWISPCFLDIEEIKVEEDTWVMCERRISASTIVCCSLWLLWSWYYS